MTEYAHVGTFGTLIDQVTAKAPDQLGSIETVVNMITGFSFADFGLDFGERIFAVLFHIGASILVFYACKEKKGVGCIRWRYSFIQE